MDSFNVNPLATPKLQDANMPPATREIPFEELQKYFNRPMSYATHQLGICTTVLKRICRLYGIPRWPYRKLRSIEQRIDTLKASTPKTDKEEEDNKNEIERLEKRREKLMSMPEPYEIVEQLRLEKQKEETRKQRRLAAAATAAAVNLATTNPALFGPITGSHYPAHYFANPYAPLPPHTLNPGFSTPHPSVSPSPSTSAGAVAVNHLQNSRPTSGLSITVGGPSTTASQRYNSYASTPPFPTTPSHPSSLHLPPSYPLPSQPNMNTQNSPNSSMNPNNNYSPHQHQHQHQQQMKNMQSSHTLQSPSSVVSSGYGNLNHILANRPLTPSVTSSNLNNSNNNNATCINNNPTNNNNTLNPYHAHHHLQQQQQLLNNTIAQNNSIIAKTMKHITPPPAALPPSLAPTLHRPPPLPTGSTAPSTPNPIIPTSMMMHNTISNDPKSTMAAIPPSLPESKLRDLKFSGVNNNYPSTPYILPKFDTMEPPVKRHMDDFDEMATGQHKRRKLNDSAFKPVPPIIIGSPPEKSTSPVLEKIPLTINTQNSSSGSSSPSSNSSRSNSPMNTPQLPRARSPPTQISSVINTNSNHININNSIISQSTISQPITPTKHLISVMNLPSVPLPSGSSSSKDLQMQKDESLPEWFKKDLAMIKSTDAGKVTVQALVTNEACDFY